MKDIKGMERGECTKCGAEECAEYIQTPTGPCGCYGCPPAKHSKETATESPTMSETSPTCASPQTEHPPTPISRMQVYASPQQTDTPLTCHNITKEPKAPQMLDFNTAQAPSAIPTTNTATQKAATSVKIKTPLGDGLLESLDARKHISQN